MSKASIEFFRHFGAIIVVVASLFGINLVPDAAHTPLDSRLYGEGNISVVADETKHLDVSVLDDGKNVYSPTEEAGFGYRYGPSIMTNADGSIDMWFAAPGVNKQWDWITYRHSPDGGKSWTQEKAVLQPTPGSPDFYSTCDPGVVNFGGYYYLGYTSTTNIGGVDNNVFVARSKSPDGPFEKWNGSGWGGAPVPIVEYTDSPEFFGAGEPSFVVMGSKLYVYYAWYSGERETRLSIADADNENWPATMQYIGTAIRHTDAGSDSADVKYIEDYGKFIAITTSKRMGPESYLAFFESNDGKSFTKVDEVKKSVSQCCHNSGISARPDGHINLADDVYAAYAYGFKWGFWATRMHKISIKLADEIVFNSENSEPTERGAEYAAVTLLPSFVGISEIEHEYKCGVKGIIMPKFSRVDEYFSGYEFCGKITYSDYDKSVVSVFGRLIIGLSPGETYITATWKGFSTTFLVTVA